MSPLKESINESRILIADISRSLNNEMDNSEFRSKTNFTLELIDQQSKDLLMESAGLYSSANDLLEEIEQKLQNIE